MFRSNAVPVIRTHLFSPLALADVTTGFYLMLFAIRAGARGNQATQRAPIGAT